MSRCTREDHVPAMVSLIVHAPGLPRCDINETYIGSWVELVGGSNLVAKASVGVELTIVNILALGC